MGQQTLSFLPKVDAVIVELTRDIPPEVEHDLTSGLGEIATISGTQRLIMLSVLPPSWVTLIADRDDLRLIFDAGVALFLTELVKEAAKSTWRSKGAIARALSIAAVWPLRRAAELLWNAHETAPRHPSIVIALSVSTHTKAICRLATSDQETLAFELALFVRISPILAARLTEIDESNARAVGDYFVELLTDGRATITWMSQEALVEESITVGDPFIE